MAVYYLIYEPQDHKTDLSVRSGGRWFSVLEGSSLGRIKNGPLAAWLYPDEDSGWPGFFPELFRESGEESAEIYFSGTIKELETFKEEAELFVKKTGREILVQSARDESLKELAMLCRAMFDWIYRDHKIVDEAESCLKDSFAEVLKQVNNMYNKIFSTDYLLNSPYEREEYLDSIIQVFYSYCDHAEKELTLAYNNEWEELLSENYKKDVLFPEDAVLSWDFKKPELELQTPEYIKDYLEIRTRWSLDEITKTMPGMYESKIMQFKQLLFDQFNYLGVLIRRKILQ